MTFSDGAVMVDIQLTGTNRAPVVQIVLSGLMLCKMVLHKCGVVRQQYIIFTDVC